MQEQPHPPRTPPTTPPPTPSTPPSPEAVQRDNALAIDGGLLESRHESQQRVAQGRLSDHAPPPHTPPSHRCEKIDPPPDVLTHLLSACDHARPPRPTLSHLNARRGKKSAGDEVSANPTHPNHILYTAATVQLPFAAPPPRIGAQGILRVDTTNQSSLTNIN